MTIAFELKGQQFVALNGGPGFPFTNAVSLVVNCDSQEEIDYFWEKLAADGGEPNVCGWLKDKFGMPWQIMPSQIWDWLSGDDPAKVKRVTGAVWQMEKLDLAELERAASWWLGSWVAPAPDDCELWSAENHADPSGLRSAASVYFPGAAAGWRRAASCESAPDKSWTGSRNRRSG